MTLAATRRYAFVAVCTVGVLATILAAGLVSALVRSPEQVAITLSEGDARALVHLILDRLAAAADITIRAMLQLL